MLKLVTIRKYHIYDIFYSPLNYFMISVANIIKPQINIKIFYNQQWKDFNLIVCSHNKTCNYYFRGSYKEKIKLKINDNEEYEVNVNKYPLLNNNATIMTTMVQNEDNYIRQWINYHHKLGVNHFIIYDNARIDDGISYCSKETTSNLKELLKDYILNGIVILIEWKHPKKTVPNNKNVEIVVKEGSVRNCVRNINSIECAPLTGQSTQQTHSIHAFRNVKYIGLFDVDEYLNPPKNYNINSILNNFFCNRKNIGGMIIKCKFFYNPNNLNEEKNNFFKIINCGKVIQNQNVKTFVRPKFVETFCIHRIGSGKKSMKISEGVIYFNHYFFLNKLNRGREKTKLKDSSILNKIKHFNIHLE